MAVLERARACADGVDDLAAREHRADRLVAAAEPLCDRLDVRRDAFLLPGVRRAGAAHAAHDLVEDEQRAMPVADLAHRLEVAVRRRHRAGGGADDGLGEERRDGVGAKPLKLGFELGGEPRHELRVRFAVVLLVIGKGRRHMAEGGREQRRIGRAAPGVAAGGERAERVAVIALPPRDEMLPLRLAALDEILPRELDAGLDRLRSAADEIGVGETAGLMPDQRFGERLGRLGGEEGGVRIGQRRGLLRHRRDHARMLMAEAGDRRAAGGVDHAPPVLGKEIDAFAADRLGRRLAQRAMQHAAGAGAHGSTFL